MLSSLAQYISIKLFMCFTCRLQRSRRHGKQGYPCQQQGMPRRLRPTWPLNHPSQAPPCRRRCNRRRSCRSSFQRRSSLPCRSISHLCSNSRRPSRRRLHRPRCRSRSRPRRHRRPRRRPAPGRRFLLVSQETRTFYIHLIMSAGASAKLGLHLLLVSQGGGLIFWLLI